MINWLQDLFISLLSPWIPVMGKISSKVKYRLLTACFMADLVLFCIVRYVLLKESYFYNTVCGIFLMLMIALLSLDRGRRRTGSRALQWAFYWLYPLPRLLLGLLF